MATQAQTNPYKYSDTNKRYQTYDYFTKHTFGGKCAKIPLDAGFTCPNKDGTCGSEGCIYCLSGSAAAPAGSIREQYEAAVRTAGRKWSPVGYIPYLQANTNTYAEPTVLRRVYEQAASLSGAVMLDIATRADCLSDEAVFEIVRISERLPVTVELGLQSSSDESARIIGRGYDFETFLRGWEKLRNAGGNIRLGVHIINGIPREGYSQMMQTARDVAALEPDAVKLHLMMVLYGTRLWEMYNSGEYTPMEKDEYVSTVCDQIELMPAHTVIARVTADSPAEHLAAPLWCRRKTEISNMIDRELYRRGSYQGIKNSSEKSDKCK